MGLAFLSALVEDIRRKGSTAGRLAVVNVVKQFEALTDEELLRWLVTEDWSIEKIRVCRKVVNELHPTAELSAGLDERIARVAYAVHVRLCEEGERRERAKLRAAERQKRRAAEV